MVSANVSFSVRLLTWVYVNIWIPIRLAYLRTKIALRPITNVTCEILSLLNIIVSFVPISVLTVLAEIINGLAKEWLRLCCLGYEEAIGVEPGSLYEKCILNNNLINMIDDYPCDSEDETIDGKNDEEETVKEQPADITEEPEMTKEVD